MQEETIHVFAGFDFHESATIGQERIRIALTQALERIGQDVPAFHLLPGRKVLAQGRELTAEAALWMPGDAPGLSPCPGNDLEAPCMGLTLRLTQPEWEQAQFWTQERMLEALARVTVMLASQLHAAQVMWEEDGPRIPVGEFLGGFWDEEEALAGDSEYDEEIEALTGDLPEEELDLDLDGAARVQSPEAALDTKGVTEAPAQAPLALGRYALQADDAAAEMAPAETLELAAEMAPEEPAPAKPERLRGAAALQAAAPLPEPHVTAALDARLAQALSPRAAAFAGVAAVHDRLDMDFAMDQSLAEHRAETLSKGYFTLSAPLRNSFRRVFRSDTEEEKMVKNDPKDMSLEARLAVWTVNALVAVFSFPVAMGLLVYNLLRGEDFRTTTHTLTLTCVMVGLNGMGTTAQAMHLIAG